MAQIPPANLAPTPIPIPQQYPTGLAHVGYASSAASGNLFTHTQSAWFSYHINDFIVPGTVGGFVSCCTGIPQVECPTVRHSICLTYWANCAQSVTTWYPPNFSGCTSGVSGTTSGGAFVPSQCYEVSAFNSFSCMSATVSSLDSNTGLGTQGTINFAPGIMTRAATFGDMDSAISRNYLFGLVVETSPMGAQDQYKDDPGIMQAFIIQLNNWIQTGGLSHIPDAELGSPDPVIGATQGIVSWRTDMLCPGETVTVTTTQTTIVPTTTQTTLTNWGTTTTTLTTQTTLSYYTTLTTQTTLSTQTSLTSTTTLSTQTSLTTLTTQSSQTSLTTLTTETSQTTLTTETTTGTFTAATITTATTMTTLTTITTTTSLTSYTTTVTSSTLTTYTTTVTSSTLTTYTTTLTPTTLTTLTTLTS